MRTNYSTKLWRVIEVTSINGEQSWDASCFNGEYVAGNVTQDYLDALEAAE